jgi:nitronate monooxygenase
MNRSRGSSPEYLCDILGIEHPVLLAPMAAVAGGALAKTVTDSGGLGILSGGYGDQSWISQGLDSIDAIRPAADIVHRFPSGS